MKDLSAFVQRWLPLGVWICFVLFISTDAGSEPHTALFLTPMVRWFDPGATPAEIQAINRGVRDFAHSAEYAVLVVLLWRAFGGQTPGKRRPLKNSLRNAGLILAATAACAIADERYQSLFRSRHSTPGDVLLDFSGGAAALAGLLIYEHWRSGRNGRSAPAPARTPRKQAPAGQGHRVLMTSNLHLHRAGIGVLEQLRAATDYTQPDIVVVAGDIGPADRAGHWLELLKDAIQDARLVICLGNEDHWLGRERWAEAPTPFAVREQFWRPAAQAAGVSCLDFSNAEFADLVFAGGYGHYDLGFREPDLEIGGKRCTDADYLAGSWMELTWPDANGIPNLGPTLSEENVLQRAGITARLEAALQTGKQVVAVTHTALFPELIGSGDGTSDLHSRFARAYAGNAALGAGLAASAQRVQLVVCGHAHGPVAPEMRNGIFGMNLGSREGALRFALLDSKTVRSSLCRFRMNSSGKPADLRQP